MIEIITVFSARLYGSRRHKNKQMLDELKGREIITKAFSMPDGGVIDPATAVLFLATQKLLTRLSTYHAKLVEERHAARP